MKPKKTVLCVDPNELSMSLRALQLEVWGHRVVRASSATLAVSLLRQSRQGRIPAIDLVLVSLPLPGAVTVLRTAKTLPVESPDQHPVCTVAVSAAGAPDPAMQYADVFLFTAAPMELRERMRVLLARKRGPRPAEKKPVQSVSIAASAEKRPA